MATDSTPKFYAKWGILEAQVLNSIDFRLFSHYAIGQGRSCLQVLVPDGPSAKGSASRS